jgi:gluconolactonase
MKVVRSIKTSSIATFHGSLLLWIVGWIVTVFATTPSQTPATASTSADIVRLSPALDRIVPVGAAIEKISGGFRFTEGPVWSRDGALVFSDMFGQVIYKVTRNGEKSEVRKFGNGPAINTMRNGLAFDEQGRQLNPMPNGLAFDKQGRLLICEMGNRRISRLEKTGELTIVAEKYRGKRLNSPDDLIVKTDGSIYFTDPPYGLDKHDDDPRKELDFNGVLRVVNGNVELLTTELSTPNGLAFSPDEKYLYVSNTESPRVIKRFEVKRDGRLGSGSDFYDYEASVDKRPGVLDGLKTDQDGNVYATAPRTVLIISPRGELLGRIPVPEDPANVAWGEEGNMLYITARTSIYRIRLSGRRAH